VPWVGEALVHLTRQPAIQSKKNMHKKELSMGKMEDVGYLYLFLREAGKAEAALTRGSMSATTVPADVT